MIISAAHNFLFVHIPKNAGTTVETLLMPHLDPATDLHVSKLAKIADNRAHFGIDPTEKLEKHSTSPRLLNALGQERWDSYFRFAFCRNPFARAYSCYSFTMQRAKADLRLAGLGPAPGAKIERERAHRKDFARMSFDEVCHRLPEMAQLHGLFRAQTTWLPKPDTVNFVGRVENLAEDLPRIYAAIGLDSAELASIPSLNQKAERDAWRDMSSASAQAIAAFYAEDFARFGYGTDLGSDHIAPRQPLRRPADQVGAGADIGSFGGDADFNKEEDCRR